MIKAKIEGKDVLLEESTEHLFGYDFTPPIKENSWADPNVTYKFKRWNLEDKCKMKYNCEIEGSKLRSFLITNSKCGGHSVFLIHRKPPYPEPTCIREIEDI